MLVAVAVGKLVHYFKINDEDEYDDEAFFKQIVKWY
jgi:hypothetical protein